MEKNYDDEVRALQRAAGIRRQQISRHIVESEAMDEEYDVYEDGTDPNSDEYSTTPMEERVKPIYGYEQITSALNSVKAAQESLNALVSDRKFNTKHKQKLVVYSKQLNDVQAELTNLSNPGTKKQEKILHP